MVFVPGKIPSRGYRMSVNFTCSQAGFMNNVMRLSAKPLQIAPLIKALPLVLTVCRVTERSKIKHWWIWVHSP
jgi:hypothetical protein